jgi:hypothetical protein
MTRFAMGYLALAVGSSLLIFRRIRRSSVPVGRLPTVSLSPFTGNDEPPSLSAWTDNEPVLPFEDLETFVPKLAVDNFWRQFVAVFRLSTRIGGYQTPIEHDQSPAESKRSECVVERQFGIREFMVGICDEHRVQK